jgi:hypothetical protein
MNVISFSQNTARLTGTIRIGYLRGDLLYNLVMSLDKRNNEFTSYQRYNKSLVINNQRENALKNAGENIINSNYNSFNEQKNSFINQNIINTDSNIQFLNNKNSLSGKNKNF